MRQRIPNAVAALLLLLPIVIFQQTWARLAVNIPKWDDHALKAFLLALSRETTLSGQLYQFWRQHNEHRIVLDRVLTVADVGLFGSLDYTRLMLAGHLALVGLLVLFGRVLHRSGRWWGLVVPVAYFLFNLGQWENMFWGMAAPQNFGVVFWVLAGLYALSFQTALIPPVLLAIAATLTSGNGLVIWPLGAVVLALQSRWRPLAGWLIATGLCIGAYFLNYTPPANNPPTVPGLFTVFTGLLAFLGSAGEVLPVGSAFANCVGVGAVLLAIAVWFGIGLLRRWPDRANWRPVDIFFVGAVGFILGTALAVARSRAGYGLDTLITSRYKIYSFVFLSLLYVYALLRHPNRLPAESRRADFGLAAVGLGLGLGLVWLSYPAYRGEADYLRRWLLASQFNWTYTQNRPVSTIDAVTTRTLANAPAFYDAALPALFAAATEPLLPADSLFRAGADWIVQNRTVTTPATAPPDAGVYLRLQSDKRTYLVPTRPFPVSGLRVRLSALPVSSRGVTAILDPAIADADTYRLDWLLVDETGRCHLRPTGQTLAVTGATRPRANTNW